jgi:dethiobiotin synthetase
VSRYFITGTDTGVGKTFVTCALARRARTLGKKVFAYKPIETGCDDGAIGPDQHLLSEASGAWQTGRLQGIYRLRLPLAPLVAARAENLTIDLGEIGAAYAEGTKQADVSLVEGAGGWRVPITPSEDMSGLARALDVPVIVVARAGLGTINHSLLTIEAIQRDGHTVAAVVLSRRPDEDLALAQSNLEQIFQRCSLTILLLDRDQSILDPLVR